MSEKVYAISVWTPEGEPDRHYVVGEDQWFWQEEAEVIELRNEGYGIYVREGVVLWDEGLIIEEPSRNAGGFDA